MRDNRAMREIAAPQPAYALNMGKHASERNAPATGRARRPWESWQPPQEESQGSESKPQEWQPTRDSASISEDKVEAGVQFVNYLVRLSAPGKRPASWVCILRHWAHRAGVAGPSGTFAKAPRSPSGHYQRHLDRALGYDKNDSKLFYHL